jgi:hypothetical protein
MSSEHEAKLLYMIEPIAVSLRSKVDGLVVACIIVIDLE